MPPSRLLRVAALLTCAAAACQPVFKPAAFPSNEALYTATLRQFEREKWDNAVLGFERLTIDLPARDTLLARAHWYLARAHARKREHLLAAQAYTRLTESFPDDSLADDALYEAGRQYERLWRRPELDAAYGQTAISTYQTLLAMYANSPRRPDAERRLAALDEMFARKDFVSGMHYFRRRAYDPAIIYFRDVIRLHPSTPAAREAYLRLAEAYKRIRYTEEANEVCAAMRRTYQGDRDVREVCGPARDTAVAPSPPVPPPA
ncbi:MAG TPA: outer membrane protein assembly factor BamD [Gemmatimonadaceae bacterium]|nr:outer membrane protein assembly factor BamD [Gemmatimonadaceae bacterium]